MQHAGVSQGAGDMLGGEEYWAFNGFLGFIEVVDRMDSSPEGKSAHNEDKSAQRNSSPLSQAMRHDPSQQHSKREGHWSPGDRACHGLSWWEW